MHFLAHTAFLGSFVFAAPSYGAPSAGNTATSAPNTTGASNTTTASGSGGGGSSPGMTTDLSLPTDKKSGQMTFYTFWNSAAVSCNPSKCPEDGYCAAIPLKYMQPSGSSKASCGKCIKIVCKDKAAIVRVMDTCPECPDVNIDISDKLFKELVGDLGMGRTNVDWGFVDCQTGAPGSGTTAASGASQAGGSPAGASGQPSGSSSPATATTAPTSQSQSNQSSQNTGMRSNQSAGGVQRAQSA